MFTLETHYFKPFFSSTDYSYVLLKKKMYFQAHSNFGYISALKTQILEIKPMQYPSYKPEIDFADPTFKNLCGSYRPKIIVPPSPGCVSYFNRKSMRQFIPNQPYNLVVLSYDQYI